MVTNFKDSIYCVIFTVFSGVFLRRAKKAVMDVATSRFFVYLSSMKQQVHPYLDGSIPYFSKNRDIKLLTTLKEWLRLKN